MKRSAGWLILVLIGSAFVMGISRTKSGDAITPTAETAPESRWVQLGSITVAQAYPAAANRDWTAVDALPDANTATWDVPNDAVGLMFRFQTTADADSTTISILVSAGEKTYDGFTDDDFMFGGSIVLTGGTQTGTHTNVYVDSCAVTDGILDLAAYDHGNNRICVVKCDAESLKRICVIATTLHAASTLYVEGRAY